MVAPKRNTSRLAAYIFALFCVALMLTAYSARNPWLGQLGHTVLSGALRPLQSLHTSLRGGLSGIWQGYIALQGAHEENERFKARLSALEQENSRLMELESETRRLSALLKAQTEYSLKGITARVIAYDPSNWEQSVTIDVGSSHGVNVGMAVVGGDGVVGQVVASGRYSARVLLITDHGSAADAIVQASRARGMVGGAGARFCELRYVLPDQEVRVGDRVITSGMDLVFPKGLLLGIVSEVGKRSGGMFRSIELKPAVDFATLENVLVVTAAEAQVEAREEAKKNKTESGK